MEVVGWSALAEPYRYTISAVVWESSRLIKINSKLLLRALDIYPQIGHKVMGSLSTVMSRRLRQITEALIRERELISAGVTV